LCRFSGLRSCPRQDPADWSDWSLSVTWGGRSGIGHLGRSGEEVGSGRRSGEEVGSGRTSGEEVGSGRTVREEVGSGRTVEDPLFVQFPGPVPGTGRFPGLDPRDRSVPGSDPRKVSLFRKYGTFFENMALSWSSGPSRTRSQTLGNLEKYCVPGSTVLLGRKVTSLHRVPDRFCPLPGSDPRKVALFRKYGTFFEKMALSKGPTLGTGRFPGSDPRDRSSGPSNRPVPGSSPGNRSVPGSGPGNRSVPGSSPGNRSVPGSSPGTGPVWSRLVRFGPFGDLWPGLVRIGRFGQVCQVWSGLVRFGQDWQVGSRLGGWVGVGVESTISRLNLSVLAVPADRPSRHIWGCTSRLDQSVGT